MKGFTFLLSLLALNQFTYVASVKIPVKRQAPTKGASFKSVLAEAGAADALGSTGDIRYTTTVTVNSVEVLVALDTGSTDLWVIPPGGLGDYNNTGIPLSLRYGDGTYGVDGYIGVAPFTFGSYSVEKQAFLHANKSTIGSMTQIGIYGLLGLGFNDPLTSPITHKIKSVEGPDADWGDSVLANIFEQHPSQPNLVALDLHRTEDLEETDSGSFNIGEIDDKYAAVVDAPKLPQYPPGNGRWTTLLDGVKVDGNALELTSSMDGTPSGKAVALLDTGAPTALLPPKLMNAIYSAIPGAVYYAKEDLWIVPCKATTIVEWEFGGQSFPMHPLDLTTVTEVESDGTKYTICISAFHAGDTEDFDLILGDSFLRNVYSVYDFGHPSASDDEGVMPVMQLLAQTDPEKAKTEAVQAREATLSTRPPEISPDQIPGATADANLSADDSSSSGSESAVEKYAPAVLGLLGANLVIGLILVVLGVLSCMRRGVKGTSNLPSRTPHYVPVGLKDEEDTAYHMPYASR